MRKMTKKWKNCFTVLLGVMQLHGTDKLKNQGALKNTLHIKGRVATASCVYPRVDLLCQLLTHG